MSKQWTQEELAGAKARSDFETLWQATIPLVKMQYGRMVKAGTVPGEGEWLQEAYLIAGEAMRTWDPEKGAYSTFLLSHVKQTLARRVRADSRVGITGAHDAQIRVIGIGDVRPGVSPDDETEDDGTFNAVLSYGGLVERDRRPDFSDIPEGLGDPADEAVRLEHQARLTAALACLPPEEREALIATQTESQPAYAERTGIPLRTVKRRCARARNSVALFLESGAN